MHQYINAFADNVIHGTDENLSGQTIASVVITGIVVVFIGLISLVILVTLYGKLFESLNNKKLKKAQQKTAETNQPAAEEKLAPAVIEDGIDEETVAVIMAAISAMSSESGKKLVVRSVKNAKPQRNAWASAAITDYTRPF